MKITLNYLTLPGQEIKGKINQLRNMLRRKMQAYAEVEMPNHNDI